MNGHHLSDQGFHDVWDPLLLTPREPTFEITASLRTSV